jgi:hypothetical protein
MRPTRKLTDSRCQCSGCGEYFNSDTAFEKHRVGQFGWTGVHVARRDAQSRNGQKSGGLVDLRATSGMAPGVRTGHAGRVGSARVTLPHSPPTFFA